MGFPIGDLFSIGSILLAGAQACQLIGNNLMAIFDIMKLKILIHLNCDSTKYIAKLISLIIYVHGRIQRGEQGVWMENHKNIGFISNTGPGPLKKSQNYQASQH